MTTEVVDHELAGFPVKSTVKGTEFLKLGVRGVQRGNGLPSVLQIGKVLPFNKIKQVLGSINEILRFLRSQVLELLVHLLLVNKPLEDFRTWIVKFKLGKKRTVLELPGLHF